MISNNFASLVKVPLFQRFIGCYVSLTFERLAHYWTMFCWSNPLYSECCVVRQNRPNKNIILEPKWNVE